MAKTSRREILISGAAFMAAPLLLPMLSSSVAAADMQPGAKANHRAKNFGPVLFGFVFGLLLLTVVFSSEIAAQRDDGPPAHNFGGTWSLRQSNGFTVTMNLKQNSRGDITGTATANARNGVSKGTVTGRAWRQNGAFKKTNLPRGPAGPPGLSRAAGETGVPRTSIDQEDKHVGMRRNLMRTSACLRG
jgi:hypothetical protein